MYFFNINALARDLKQEKVTEREKAKYLFGNLLFLELAQISSWSGSTFLSPIVLASKLLALLIFVIGFFACLKANQNGDNKDFVARFMSLSFPLALLTLVLAISIAAIAFLAMLLAGIPFREAQFTEFLQIIVLAISPIWYLILYRKIKFIAQKESI